MTIAVSRILADAGALWRRDRDLPVRIALPFVLLPTLALQLLVPAPIPPVGTSFVDAVRLQSRFAGDHAGAVLLASALICYGHAALFALYCAPGTGDVRGVLVRALRMWPRIVLLVLLTTLLSLNGVLFFVAGRLLPAGAVLFGVPGTSAAGALRRAVRLTRGHALTTSALAALLLVARFVLLEPFLAMEAWLRGLRADNPVALAIVDGAGAGVGMLVTIAGVLVATALYRALAEESAAASSGT